jgi:holo-[acyl-carrier protein] synthase
MVIGLGVDVFEVSRMERALREGDPGFTRQLFTPDEITYGERQSNSDRLFSEWFALKEAVLKALGAPDASAISWRDVELHPAARDVLTVTLHGEVAALARRRGVGRARLSHARAHGVAMARVIVEAVDD